MSVPSTSSNSPRNSSEPYYYHKGGEGREGEACTGIENWICKEVIHAATSCIERYHILYEARGVLFIPQAATADELQLGLF